MLLFDHNLSPRLVDRLSDVFADSTHVYLLGLEEAFDVDIWTHAREHNLTIVTKDIDFAELAALRGYPPKVVWVRLGNCTTQQVEELLRAYSHDIASFGRDESAGVLALPPSGRNI